ncbi:glycosyltransferase family 2 protein [Sphingomonas sp. CV7422]|uniref:glycosyltransferase family 2 protein n=1 Tax=Sphingomonas sp. CV7422 TaxID=3018036 RepID=UPI0022FE11C2|nr:glycosyltransferase family 2 protein [Sphingomonas sp. CV7422]
MRLSICIPTYNRGEFLGELFDSILAQQGYDCELEIVVSDNASTDTTSAVVEAYRERLGKLIYRRSPTNMGADRNYLRVVELASGDWCWLMGSDDILEPGALAQVARVLASDSDIAGLSVGRNIRTFTLQKRGEERLPKGLALTNAGRMTGAEPIFTALAAYFAYLSGQVVKKRLWDEAVAAHPVDNYLNAYVHVYVIGRMLQAQPRWFYLAEPLVGWRDGNDSFLADGQFNRLRIDVVGFEEIARGLFGTASTSYRHINADIATGLLFHRLLAGRMNKAPASFYTAAARLTVPRYWKFPSFWLRTVPIFLLPGSPMRAARSIFRQLKTKNG